MVPYDNDNKEKIMASHDKCNKSEINNLSDLQKFLTSHQDELVGIIAVLEEINGHTHDKLLGPIPKNVTKAVDVPEDISSISGVVSVIKRQENYIKELTKELAIITS